MTLPAACPGTGNPCPVSLHKCWRRVANAWGHGEAFCARNVDPHGIGLCPEHLEELREASASFKRHILDKWS